MGPPFIPRAVVFDLDGLLVDSEDAWGRAAERVVRDLGHPWDPAIHSLMLGRGPEDASRVLAAFLGGSDHWVDVDRRLLAAALDEFAVGVQPRPGAVSLVKRLSGRVPLGVATNSRRALAEGALASAGLAGLVQTLVAVEDVARPKPDPEPYVEACRRLGTPEAHTVVLEDSPVGVAAGKAAGCWVIGVPSRPDSDLSRADLVVPNLEGVDGLL